MKFKLRSIFASMISLLLFSPIGFAQKSELISVDLTSGESVDVRQYKAKGDTLLLGLACDEGDGVAEMATASILSGTDIEVWLPDLLSAHFLPKLKSSFKDIPGSDVVNLIDAVIKASDKKVYLISSGQASAVLLRGLVQWERDNPENLDAISGVILLFPRLNAIAPEPGKEPVYIDEVGQTKTAIAILEGAKTPNSWALAALKEKLQAQGSLVTTALIPGVRGFFYEKAKPTLPEEVVTSQLAGLVRASVVKLDMLKQQNAPSIIN